MVSLLDSSESSMALAVRRTSLRGVCRTVPSVGMSLNPESRGFPARSVVDGTRLSGFIYGTVTGLVALGGAGTREDYAAWWEIASRVVLGAAAVWVSHAYSELLSHRVVSGRRLEFHELGAGLSNSWPIVIAGLLLAAPLVPAGLGVVSVETAANASRLLGITILALIGLVAEQSGEHRWGRRLLHAGLSAGLGAAVVGAELLVHR